RDRIYGEVEWAGQRFLIVDTGGIVPDDEAVIPVNILRQAEAAISEAAALVWVVDTRAGVVSLDEELAALLRATGKHVLVAANKVDTARLEPEANEFHRFGFAGVVPVSAEGGDGTGELLDALVEHLRANASQEKVNAEGMEGEAAPREVRLAIVGRPNVGKSSLLNRLLGQERMIVSPIPGTTRDAIDTLIEREGNRFRLIDTAGIRRKGKTTEMTEKLSVMMARRSLERAAVAIIVVDALEGPVAVDAHIAGYAVDAGCSIIIAVNKWDALENKLTGTAAEFERRLRDQMKFLDWAPVITVSALAGQRVEKILPLAVRANEARNLRIPTSQLNDFFERVVAPSDRSAPTRGGRSRVHVQYVTQTGVRPPTFVAFTAGGKPGLHFSYERRLHNLMRQEFEFFATPLRIIERHRSERKKKK
nr:ribosome biogenesis GTPase Der [Pyrinomonadaceae bacterium]